MSNIVKVSNAIESRESLPIRYDLYLPSQPKSALPVLLFLHGFKGFKDWGPFPSACEELARDGFGVVAFNFSHNGVGENLLEFERLDLFERQTLSRDLDDVGSVIEAIKTGKIGSDRARLNSDRIGVIGHSRGGHTAVSAAAEYPEIQSLVTWSSVADYNARWSEKMLDDWKRQGYTEIENARTGQIMRVGREVYEDAIGNKERVIALERVRELHLPALFIAGREDEAVSWKDSEQLYKSCPSDIKELKVIPGTGHTFGAAHPFEEEEYPDPFADVLDTTSDWFADHLAGH